MRTVFIAGAGLIPVGEHWDHSLRELALDAVEAAQTDAARQGADGFRPEALFVGNMLASELSHQAHLGALIADFAGMRGIEAAAVEGAGGEGTRAGWGGEKEGGKGGGRPPPPLQPPPPTAIGNPRRV